jgi:hypothetical protein
MVLTILPGKIVLGLAATVLGRLALTLTLSRGILRVAKLFLAISLPLNFHGRLVSSVRNVATVTLNRA